MSGENGDPPDKRSAEDRSAFLDWRMILPALLVIVVVGAAAVVISSGAKSSSGAGQAQQVLTGYDGLILRPLKQAPALDTLHNYDGEPFKLSDFHGKAVFVTFLYTHCPDVCPVIAAQLHNVVRQLGPQASKVGLVAVSVDPKGDTPAEVNAFLHKHGFENGELKYLTGTEAQLAPVWKQWNIGAKQDYSHPNTVSHTAAVYGISGSGKLTTVYAPPLVPSQLIHDVAPLQRD